MNFIELPKSILQTIISCAKVWHTPGILPFLDSAVSTPNIILVTFGDQNNKLKID